MNNKPISLGSKYVMKPGATYHDVCQGMRLDESELEIGLLALEIMNGPEHLNPLFSSYDAKNQYIHS